jgi:hypothetical protein
MQTSDGQPGTDVPSHDSSSVLWTGGKAGDGRNRRFRIPDSHFCKRRMAACGKEAFARTSATRRPNGREEMESDSSLLTTSASLTKSTCDQRESRGTEGPLADNRRPPFQRRHGGFRREAFASRSATVTNPRARGIRETRWPAIRGSDAFRSRNRCSSGQPHGSRRRWDWFG